MGSGWMNTELRDAVLESLASHGYYKADDPLWLEVSTAFCWEDVRPVVDYRGWGIDSEPEIATPPLRVALNGGE
jgi:hypothetical protein